MKKFFLFAAFLVSLFLISSTVYAADEGGSEVKQGLYLNTNLSGSVNPLGLAIKADLFYRLPLIDKGGMLWKSTKLDVGVQEYFSPSFQRASAFVKIEPIAVFDLAAYAGYDYMYDGNNDTFGPGFITFGETDEYDTDARKGRDGIAKGGFRMKVEPRFKIAFGPVAALYTFSLEYHNYNYDGYYYDPSTFILQKGEDFSYQHDVKVLYKLGPWKNVGTFRLGINFIDFTVDSNKKGWMRMSGMVIYQPKWSFQSPDIEPYFVMLLGSHIEEKYYQGKFYFAFLMGFSYRLF